MVGFSYILERFFRGFDIAADTQLVRELSTVNPTASVLIVKKSGYFLLFVGLGPYIALSILGIIGIGLLWYIQIFDTMVKIILTSVHILNIIFWIYSFGAYLMIHRRVFHHYTIMSAQQAVEVLTPTDTSFRRLINDTGTLFIIYILFVLFYGAIILFLFSSFPSLDLWFLIICCFIKVLQMRQIIRFATICVDLSMDFLFITKTQIKYYDQINLGLKTKSLGIDDIESVTSKKDGFWESLLNFGTISLTMLGVSNLNEITFPYMKSPEQLEKAINTIKES